MQRKKRRGGGAEGEEETVTEMWKRVVANPRTSAMGVLLALTTVLGVLQAQGVSWGQAGKGSVVSLVSAVATALLGLLAKD